MTSTDALFDPSPLLAAIVQSSDDAIVSKTLDGIITSWNLAAERMFGYTAPEVIGKSITIIIPTDRLNEEERVLSSIRQGRAVEHFETVRRRKDGQLLDISLTVSPVRLASGQIIGASKIARDITEQKRLRRQLELASKMKDDFLATLSHELRTPLNAILGYSQILRSNMVHSEERRQHGLEIIERNARALAQLVSDVLDVSSIVAGKIRLERRPCDAVEIATTVLDSLRPTFEAKGVRLERRIDLEVGPVLADPERLQQIFWNLLTNAVKFTPAGGVVTVTLWRDNGDFEFIVADTGVGIGAEFLPHLFERFRQAETGTTRQFGGLGLGLALVRHFTDLHGGRVSAESEGEGRGATVRVRLPRGIESEVLASLPATGDGTATADGHGQLESVTALAIDDDADSLRLVRDSLQAAGAKVLCARSAGEAMDVLDGERPDVIIADVGMPETDGWQFITRLRRRDADHGGMIPAAALTAYATPDDRRRSLRAGFQMHLTKPFHPGELVDAIASLVRP